MRTLFLITLLSSLTCLADEKIAPTGLTLVVCDSENRVLDTVLVPVGAEVTSVKFVLPKDSKEIRVFALGKHIDEDLPEGFFVKGRPKDKEWFGRGFVEAHIENGILVAIDGNGFGPFEMNEKLSTQILTDIAEAKKAHLTTVVFAEDVKAIEDEKADAKATSAPQTERDAKLIELSKAFWNAISEADVDEAKKMIFVENDAPKQKQSKVMADWVLEEFVDLVAFTKGKEAEFKLKGVVVEKAEEKHGANEVRVTLLISEPGEDEADKLTTTWHNTEKSGWKLVDL